MRKDDQQYCFVSPINVSTGSTNRTSSPLNLEQADTRELLAALVVSQQRQNDLLEEVVEQLGAAQRQRSLELANWKRLNPQVAESCRQAAQKLAKVQAEYLSNMSQEIDDGYETIMESEYFFNEFLDKFGPRLMHLNVVLQILNQLGSCDTQTRVPQ